jgi:hypothetical protein
MSKYYFGEIISFTASFGDTLEFNIYESDAPDSRVLEADILVNKCIEKYNS